jgi:glycosyltransferase involved in cell wall biosynthesis
MSDTRGASEPPPRQRPFFSVCVPVYNGAVYLRQCLDSILAQTFQDFEILVVDDGSSDDSVALISEYAQREPRLRFYQNQTNLGLVANWNKCLSLAQGAWVKFLFQDDFWAPTCLERVRSQTDGRSLVFHGRQFAFVGEVRKSLRDYYTSELARLPPGLSGVHDISPELCSELIVKHPALNFFGEPSNVAFRRELSSRFGVFDERLVQLCDYEYWTRIASSHGAYRIPEDLSTFRVHGGAASSANLATREFRYRYLDRLILFERFHDDPMYANLRKLVASHAPSRIESLCSLQQSLVAHAIRELSTDARRHASAQLLRFAPTAHANIMALATRRFGILRSRLTRLIRRVKGEGHTTRTP